MDVSVHKDRTRTDIDHLALNPRKERELPSLNKHGYAVIIAAIAPAGKPDS
jgi:hypothetical protein